mgnify:CR=1 FL=1
MFFFDYEPSRPERSDTPPLERIIFLGAGAGFFQLRISANLREENFKGASRKARSHEKAPAAKRFF